MTYNSVMSRVPALAVIPLMLVSFVTVSFAQASKSNPASSASAGERAAELAENGHCPDALPLLKKAIHQTTDKALQKRIGLDGVHCAMTHNAPYESLDFLRVLTTEIPRDPDMLYTATHAFSDLSLRSSQDLAREAPFSYQVHELNAEALELQGKWDEAAAEYRRIIEINPMLAGIHVRLGRALLSKPQPSSTDTEEAKRNFEQELDIDPRNTIAEYVLGELARNAGDFPTAIRHFSNASKLDVGFGEAYLGLGTSLVASKRFAEAIAPLEVYEKLAPDSPSGHYQLALAYAGAGRKDDANREAALQRESAENLEKVKRRVAEGLQRQEPVQQGAQTPSPQ